MSFYGFPYGNKVRRRWWSFINWCKGYRWGAIQHHRCCGHTTPSHYAACRTNGRPSGGSDGF